MTSYGSNIFLNGLTAQARETVLSHAIAVDLPLHTVLYEERVIPRYAYFLTSGLASVVTAMSGGASSEIGFIGREGVVGSLHLLGNSFLSTRCMMQLSGNGLKVLFSHLQAAYDTSGEVRNRILHFVQEQASMVSQIAGCNRLHTAEQRLSRWLLMAQDRTQSDTLKFTQEYLAEMTGTQRTTVTVIAGALQEQGLISYVRGTVRIMNRQGLEKMACECYFVTKQLHDNLYIQKTVPHPLAS